MLAVGQTSGGGAVFVRDEVVDQCHRFAMRVFGKNLGAARVCRVPEAVVLGDAMDVGILRQAMLAFLFEGAVFAACAGGNMVAKVDPRRFFENQHVHLADVDRLLCMREALASPKYPGLPIFLPVANLAGLRLEDRTLGAVFRRLNRVVYNVPYAGAKKSFAVVGGRVVFRPNHNGCHGVRQVRTLEAALDMVARFGKQPVLFDDELLMQLKLGTYLIRGGRIDESGSGDPYRERSAQSYAWHAAQFGDREEVVRWVQKAMVGGDDVAYHLLKVVHELDLMRCFSKRRLARSLDVVKRHLSFLVEDRMVDQCQSQLVRFARQVCLATGEKVHFCVDALGVKHGAKKRWDARFARCSLDGAFAWRCVSSVPLPRWQVARL